MSDGMCKGKRKQKHTLHTNVNSTKCNEITKSDHEDMQC